jgi:hypothetical protein
VFILLFLGKDTIDEHIYSIIEAKRGIANAITGSTENIQAEVIDIMMSSLFNKKNKADPEAPDYIEVVPVEVKKLPAAAGVAQTLFEQQEGF